LGHERTTQFMPIFSLSVFSQKAGYRFFDPLDAL